MDFEIISDENLVKMAKSDKDALESLITRYKGMVISLSRKYYLQGGDIEDLISEGMIGLYRAILSYDEGKNATFSTFSYVCVTRQLQNLIKRDLAKKHAPLNTSAPISHIENLEGGVNPEELFLYKEEEAKQTSLLRELLSRVEFEVLTEFMEGLSYKEIAKKLSISEKTVDNALTRARKKIQENYALSEKRKD